jgi:hypothetical protein
MFVSGGAEDERGRGKGANCPNTVEGKSGAI